MVQGAAELRRRFQALPQHVRSEVTAEIEKQAQGLVAQMNAIKPSPAIKVAWTWGDAPRGAVTLARTRGGRAFGKVAATIYATGISSGSEFPALATWFEFGTAERVQKTTGRYTGRIAAQPYFFPAYRANKTRIRSAISRAVTRAVKRAAK